MSGGMLNLLDTSDNEDIAVVTAKSLVERGCMTQVYDHQHPDKLTVFGPVHKSLSYYWHTRPQCTSWHMYEELYKWDGEKQEWILIGEVDHGELNLMEERQGDAYNDGE